MRRQFVPQVAARANAAVGGGLSQVRNFANQLVDLLLMTHDDLVQLVKQILLEAGLDLEIGQALPGVVCVIHTAFCQGFACADNRA